MLTWVKFGNFLFQIFMSLQPPKSLDMLSHNGPNFQKYEFHWSQLLLNTIEPMIHYMSGHQE